MSDEVYRAPKVYPGDIVYYYRDGAVSDASTPCVIEKAGDLCAVLMRLESTAMGRRINSVRHVSDPGLATNIEWKKNGAWDFTPGYKALHARIAALESSIAMLVFKGPIRFDNTPPENTIETKPLKRGPGRPRKVALAS